MALTQEQLDIITRTVLGEARGEGELGMVAVAHNIRNRSLSGKFPDDPAKVALQPYQYSTWNKGEGGNNPQQFSPSSRQYQNARKLVEEVWGGNRPDPTNGALFYHTPQVNPAWAGEVNKHGTTRVGNHIFYNGHPVPPGEIPNVVASKLDTQRSPPPLPKPRPAVRKSAEESVRPYLTADMQVRGDNLPPLVAAQITPGLGSLTPDFFKTPAPPARLPDIGSNSSPIGPGPTSLASVQDMYGRPKLPSRLDPVGAGPQSLASVQDMYGRPGGVGQPPATRSVPSVPVPGPMNGVGSMPSFAALQSEFGRPAAPVPTTAIPGPNSLPKGQERLVAGLHPMAPTPVPDAVPAVATAIDVVPNLPGFPPLPRPRPVQFSMPTPMGQRPTLPMPRPVTGFPTAFAQRPAQAPTMRVTVNGANSYSGGGGSSGGSQPKTITGSSTGKTYNVGQQYQSGGYRFVATPDGFKNLGRV